MHFAKQIRVEGPFMLHTSTNVEDLLSTLDAKVYLNMVNAKEDVTKASTSLTSSLTQEIVDRKAADTAEVTARSEADTTLQTNLDTETANRKTEDANILASEVSRAGDSIFGDLIFYTDASLGTETLRMTPATGDITSSGDLSLLGGMVKIETDENGQPMMKIEDKDKAEKLKFNGSDGTITLNGSITISGTVDGVDVSQLNDKVNVNHETRITALEGTDIPNNSVSIEKLKTTLAASGTINCGAADYTVIDEVCQSYNGNQSFTVTLSAGSYLPLYEMSYSVVPNSSGSAVMKPTIEIHSGNDGNQVCVRARIYWNASCGVGSGASAQMKYAVYKLLP